MANIASMLAFISEWSTPTVLFCVLNLMIAIIFIASNFKSPDHHNTPSQLTRSSSSESTEYNNNSTSQLGSSPSLLQRVKSIDFSFSSFHNSFSTESEQLGNSPTLWLLDRVMSFKLTSPFNSDQNSGYTSSSKDEHSGIHTHHDSDEDNNVTSDKSHHTKLANCKHLLVSEASVVAPVNGSPSKLTESSGVKKVVASDGSEEFDDQKRPAPSKAAVRVHDDSVDAKADDFIKRFKQQLKLQRLDSLQRLREMLNRGT